MNPFTSAAIAMGGLVMAMFVTVWAVVAVVAIAAVVVVMRVVALLAGLATRSGRTPELPTPTPSVAALHV